MAYRHLTRLNRRAVIMGVSASGLMLMTPGTALAQNLGGLLGSEGSGLSSILGKATDSALDDLSQPGAFFNDEEVRIGLPMLDKLTGSNSGVLGTILGAGQKLGAIPGLDGIIRGINDAAGVAAGEAKPIFRDAIDNLSFSDAPGIIRESDGGTQYLRRSSNDTLHEKLEPLVDTALGDAGIHGEIDKLGSNSELVGQAGLNRESINRTVTDQGLDGIFTYIGREERAFRKDPLGGIGGLLGK
ncbi:MAG: DUF4197 domain-containing protein [Pseudomonadota bacterium]